MTLAQIPLTYVPRILCKKQRRNKHEALWFKNWTKRLSISSNKFGPGCMDFSLFYEHKRLPKILSHPLLLNISNANIIRFKPLVRPKYILRNGTSWWSTSTFIGNPMKKDGMTIKQIFSQKRQQNKLTKRHKNIFFSGRFLLNVNTKFAFIRPSSNRSFLLLFVCSITPSKTYSISFSLNHCSHNL